MRKRIDHWCSVVPEKIPTLGPTVQWETRQASFPTVTVGPRVGIFLSPLNTNDEFYLSHMGKNNGNSDLVCKKYPISILVTFKTFSFCYIEASNILELSLLSVADLELFVKIEGGLGSNQTDKRF